MKILVLGDIHGRACWKSIIKKELPDLTVFLGDYVSSHEEISAAEQIQNLELILKYKEENMGNVILLRGNHDMQHLGYAWAQCSGYSPHVAAYMVKNKERFLSLTQWIYIKDNLLFSHAGISKEWLKYYKIENIDNINNIEPCETFAFTPCKFSDYQGTSATQPCTWIRPSTLCEYAIEDYIQIVGHTPTRQIVEVQEYLKGFNVDQKSVCPIWLCDNLPEQYLVIDNNEFKVIDSEVFI